MDFPKVSSQRREFLERATETYYRALPESAGAEYLKTRGITGQAAQHFRLGYLSEPLEGHDWYRGRLAIPYITPTGVSQLRFRMLGDGKPKYDQEAGTFTPLFNVRDLHREEPWIALCEGEIDTITMWMCGVPAVGLGGVSQWTAHKDVYRRLLEDYERVFIVMDPDDAGQGMAKEIARTLTDPVNVVLHGDVNDTFLLEGQGAILRALGL